MKRYSELNRQEKIALFRQSLVNIIDSIETIECVADDVLDDTLTDIADIAHDYYYLFGDLLDCFDENMGDVK